MRSVDEAPSRRAGAHLNHQHSSLIFSSGGWIYVEPAGDMWYPHPQMGHMLGGDQEEVGGSSSRSQDWAREHCSGAGVEMNYGGRGSSLTYPQAKKFYVPSEHRDRGTHTHAYSD